MTITNDPANKDGLTESEFLAAYSPKPSVTADILIFAVNEELDRLKLLLIKRKNHPYINCRALPGGFVGIDESCEEAAMRELCEETGLKNIYLEQLCTVSEPKRDLRMRVISVAYMALINQGEVKPIAGDDAADAAWFELDTATEGKVSLINGEETLSYTYNKEYVQNGIISERIERVSGKANGIAFDHAEIIHKGLCRLRNKAEYTSLLFGLMDEEFTLPDLQRLYETVLGKKLYKANFRNSISDKVEFTGKKRVGSGRGRAPELYRYKGEY
jgi:ADP-ribose pyrophosphatase YjhB (NUDIX family)